MSRYLARRLLGLPLILLLANFFGFAFAYTLGPVQAARNPYSSLGAEVEPLSQAYLGYASNIVKLDFGRLPNNQPLAEAVGRAAGASFGLVILALALSIATGLGLGLLAAQSSPPRVSWWLSALASVGIASPGFYLGILFISFFLMMATWGPDAFALIPIQGYGFDAHLLLPVLTLMIQPTLRVAQITAGSLVEELGKEYVLAALAFGHTPRLIRTRLALRNVAAPVLAAVGGSARFLIAELLVIERLFDWPGLGRLLSSTLVTTSVAQNFMHPPLVAALVTLFAAFFVGADILLSSLARWLDPRLTSPA